MPAKNRRLIFELSTKEKEYKFRTVVSEAINNLTALNQPIVYRNELCVKPNLFIHKYPNGKSVLIEQDAQTSIEKTILVLH